MLNEIIALFSCCLVNNLTSLFNSTSQKGSKKLWKGSTWSQTTTKTHRHLKWIQRFQHSIEIKVKTTNNEWNGGVDYWGAVKQSSNWPKFTLWNIHSLVGIYGCFSLSVINVLRLHTDRISVMKWKSSFKPIDDPDDNSPQDGCPDNPERYSVNWHNQVEDSLIQ